MGTILRTLESSNAGTEIDIVATHEGGSFDAWQVKRWAWDCAPLHSEAPKRDFFANTWIVKDLIFSEASYDAMTNQHTHRHIQNTGQFVFVYRLVIGDSWVRSGHEVLRQNTGDIVVVDYAQPFESFNVPSLAQGMFCKHHELGLRPGDIAPIQLISGGSVMGQVLHNEFSTVFEILKGPRKATTYAAFHRLRACLQKAVNPSFERTSDRLKQRAALRRLILRYIEENLDDTALTTNTILRKFGTSRAGLYRMFEPYGGVRNYISDRRLLRALAEISESPFQRGIISDTADRWGFSSSAAFNRSVRSKFGVPPGAVFAAPLTKTIDSALPPVL